MQLSEFWKEKLKGLFFTGFLISCLVGLLLIAESIGLADGNVSDGLKTAVFLIALALALCMTLAIRYVVRIIMKGIEELKPKSSGVSSGYSSSYSDGHDANEFLDAYYDWLEYGDD